MIYCNHGFSFYVEMSNKFNLVGRCTFCEIINPYINKDSVQNYVYKEFGLSFKIDIK